MADAFDMFDIVNDSDTEDNIENEDYNAELIAIMGEMEQLAPVVVNIQPIPQMVEVVEFDENNNVLDPIIREEFRSECIFEETNIFTRPVSTTNTMEGYLSNVQFHERDLIEELLPSEDLVLYRCNYGKIKYEGYTEPVKERKTNRGRKKKEKKKKLRKKQGTGNDFNSQITFVVRSTRAPEPINGIIPYGSQVYKFKVFRTGKLQLPGVHQNAIEDVIECTKKIAEIMNFHLHPGVEDPTKITKVVNVNPVMKNYKFVVKLPPGKIIDLEAFKVILNREKLSKNVDIEGYNPIGRPEHPDIFVVKYTRQDTKLSIKFSTPIFKKPKKRTRINIFMRGKINILGAFDAKVTGQICQYLHWIFEQNYNELVVTEGVVDNEEHTPMWEPNIEQCTDEEFRQILDSFINWVPDLPPVTELEYADIINMIDEYYTETVTTANNYLRGYFEGTEIGDYIE
ncbi:Hypothetical protein PACV_239 [Pacmanvirus A23]|uniref:Hypothetical protein n=1 Tax=Pacmanvirus A23 TaxID=1932881 RepID=UPI000A093323|nr:Hypothetical protein B9W72_gp237 [Pacmanvirus A23]SIP85954.1 Hypothetical protein PACV_239 [Pacmanvirus A23]